MITLLRRVRQRLLTENKLSRYVLYALGEIILVVFGILIALQVSNWNQGRLASNKMQSYYKKLTVEIEEQIIYTNETIEGDKRLAKMQKEVLVILSSKDLEKIPELKKNLGAVATSWTNQYSFEIFDEFVSKGLLSEVSDPKLKTVLIELQDRIINFKGNDDYIDNQYNTLIEPYFSKYLNYAEVALPRYKKNLVQGGPETNFEALFNSMELWNVSTFKLETTNLNIGRLLRTLVLLETIKSQLRLAINQ